MSESGCEGSTERKDEEIERGREKSFERIQHRKGKGMIVNSEEMEEDAKSERIEG